MRILSQILGDSAGQLGNLGDLANGQVGGPTAEDRALVEGSIGATTDIAERQLKQVLSRLGANLDEDLAARGIQGSSIEGFNRAGLQAGAFDQISNMVDRSRVEGSQALMNLPFQRAGVQLGANAELFNRIAGTSQPSLQALLQSRLGNATTTQRSPFISGDAIVGALGSAIPQ